MADLNKILEAINEVLNPTKIILFGSMARGDNKKDSDIDLAVIQKEKPQIGQRGEISQKLIEKKYSWEATPDIHIFSEDNFNERLKNNSFFIREIMKGKVLYAQ